MNITISDLIYFLGGWTIIITGIVSFLSHFVTQRILKGWDLRNQKIIDELRHEQSKTQVILKELNSGIISNQSIFQERRIEAVEKLWTAIIAMKEFASEITTFFSIILPNEYYDEKPKHFLEKVGDNFVMDFIDISKDLEVERPFLGETLWLQFFIYRAFLGRLELIAEKIKNGKHVNDWRDNGIDQLLRIIFTDEEYKLYKTINPTQLDIVLNILDSKILRESSEILSGKKSLLESYQNVMTLNDLISKEEVLQRYSGEDIHQKRSTPKVTRGAL